jgi:type 1 glutamine amidotransferase
MQAIRLSRTSSFAIFALALYLPLSAGADGGWQPLFDGQSLAGWQGKSGLWSVKDGAIVGSTKPDGLKHNTFLVTEREFENFVLRLKFKYDGTGNSGVQFRSGLIADRDPQHFAVRGYQADIGEGYYGSLYDEERRGMLQASRLDWVKRFLKLDGKAWNDYEVRAIGNQVTLTINGLVTARYTEKNDAIPRKGRIALQLHSGGPMEISFKDIAVEEIQPKKLLYVTHSAGFRHSSLPLSQEVLTKVGRDSGYFAVTATNEVDQITPAGLAQYDGVAFYTTGDLAAFPLSKENREHLIQWIKDGHAFIGFHSATDTYKDWEPFWEMIGGSFDGHPWHEEITIDVEDPSHPSVLHLDTHWVITDEIYQFKNYSRDRLHIILSMNAKSEKGKGKRADKDNAIAWCREFGKGKVFYTSLGHREDVWTNPDYQKHVEGGVLYALGVPGYEADETPGLPKPAAEFVPLFTDSLDGWTIHTRKGAQWTLKDGVLSGRNEQGHIFSPKEYQNFHLKAEIRVGENSNSGMYFRTQLAADPKDQPDWPNGMEAQVNSSHGDPVRTGSLYGLVKVFEQLIPAGEWGTQEVIAVGEYIVIKVNGRVTVRGRFPFDHRRHFPKGRFAFQQHHNGSEVDYRNVVVRELPARAD